MSNSGFQSLLMESGDSLPEPVEACVSDSYRDCGPTNDPYWNSVVLLAHFNNDYVDVLGHTLVGSGTSFSTTAKYGSHSVALNGIGGTFSGTGIVSTSSSSLDFNLAPGDFAIEAWFYPTEVTGGRPRTIVNITQDNAGTPLSLLSMSYSGSGSSAVRFYYPTSSTFTTSVISSVSPTINSWNHLALVRYGTFYRLYLNGIIVATATSSYIRPSLPCYVYIGNTNGGNDALPGYIDDVRITKGVARYKDQFTLPRAEFPEALETVWSESSPRTILLSHLDTSSVELPTTNGWDSSITAGGLITYSLDNRRVVYPNGVGTDPITTTYVLRSRQGGKWYWEIYCASFGNAGRATWESDDNSYGDWWLGWSSSNTSISWENPSGGHFTTVATGLGSVGYTWCFAFDINTGELWVRRNNDTWIGGGDPELGTNPTVYGIARPGRPGLQLSVDFGTGGDFTLNMKTGELTYSAPAGFTPYGDSSSAAYDADLVAEDGNCIADKVLTLQEQTSFVFDTVKFGSSAIRVGSRGRNTKAGIKIKRHEDFLFSTADFTVEFWAYRLSNDVNSYLWTYGSPTLSYLSVGIDGLIDAFYNTSTNYTRSNIGTFPLNQWNHVVIQRRSGNFEIYLNGILLDSVATSGANFNFISSTHSYSMNFGGISGTSLQTTNTFDGYIDEIRVVKNIAVYTTNFDINTLPFCGGESGTYIPTSGTEFLRGSQTTVQAGQLTVLENTARLSSFGSLVRTIQGNITASIGAPTALPLNRNYGINLVRNLTSTASQTVDWTFTFTFQTDGRIKVEDLVSSTVTYVDFVSPVGTDAAIGMELQRTAINLPGGTTITSAWFDSGSYISLAVNVPATVTIPISIDAAESTKSLSAFFTFYVRPNGNDLFRQEQFYGVTVTLNKPIIPPVSQTYPDFDSGQKADAQEGNLFIWYFNPDGTIRSGTVSGTVIGRWIDAFTEDIASKYRLVVYSDPLPSGFTRVIPATNISATLVTSGRVRYYNPGLPGDSQRVGFTVRVYPTLDNPRYGEAGYLGQYTFTMVIPQISGV